MTHHLERFDVTAAACVLVVDSDDANLEAVCCMLEDDGYEVVAAFGGEQAWHTLRKTRPAPTVVIVDVVGCADGVRLVQRIQSDPTVSDTPMVAMVERTRSSLAGAAAGATACVSTPVRRDVLLAAVEAALRSRQQLHGDGTSERFSA
jgi:chemosensory pili system protein ChpA (sensor histidine kinase/response regulator)